MAKLFFGTPEGIKEGQKFADRKAIIQAGVHRSTMHGIEGNANEGVSAIMLSGGYEKDFDLGDEIVYTSHLGNGTKHKQQYVDQSLDDPANQALMISKDKNLPVRVLRGFKYESTFAPRTGYRYGGLYTVTEQWEEIGKHGFKVFRFRLMKQNSELEDPIDEVREGALVKVQPKGKDAKWFSIGVEPPKALYAQKLSNNGMFSEHLLGTKPGDSIDFGIGFTVLEIKRYMSNKVAPVIKKE